MGSAVSRAGKRKLPVPDGSRARNVIGEIKQTEGLVGSHPQTAAVLSEEDELDRRVAATWSHMKGNITTQPVAVVDHKMVLPRYTRADRLNMMKGRLDSKEIRTILSEYEQQVRVGPPDVPSLAAKFGVDEALLQKVVLYNKAPPRNETMEG